MTPEFHPAATAELVAAVRDGAIHGRDVGRKLRDEAFRITELLCDKPRFGEPLTKVYRRFSLKGAALMQNVRHLMAARSSSTLI